jgi:DNA replication factor GINS
LDQAIPSYNNNNNNSYNNNFSFNRYYHFTTQMDFIQKFYSIKYLMEEIRITFKRNFSINIDGLSFDAKEGEIDSVPRWLAQILEENNSIEIQDTDVLIYISRSLNRERISKPHDLSGIDLDFYIRANDFIKRLKDKEKESFLVSLNSFVTSRIEKIVKLAAASSLSIELEKKLSAEEKELYNFIHQSSSEFKQITVNKN